MTRVIVRSVPERRQWLDAIFEEVPHLEVIADQTRNAMDTFLRAKLSADEDAAIFLEDDAQLTQGFLAKAQAVIDQHPDRVINFFSRRALDLTKGARWAGGSDFQHNLCYYLPPGYAIQIYDYYPLWPNRLKPPAGGCDWIIQDWLKARRERFWISVPSLVQHRVSKSTIDPRRARSRQSMTFQP